MGLGQAWSDDPDLNARDPNNLNDHLQVSTKQSGVNDPSCENFEKNLNNPYFTNPYFANPYFVGYIESHLTTRTNKMRCDI